VKGGKEDSWPSHRYLLIREREKGVGVEGKGEGQTRPLHRIGHKKKEGKEEKKKRACFWPPDRLIRVKRRRGREGGKRNHKKTKGERGEKRYLKSTS